jgi:twitching motility two-component system response regulator PilG
MAGERILIADDDPDALEILATVLRYAGYAVTGVSDGVQALQKVRDEKPALAILDIMMPLMDGYQVCEQIKQDPGTRHIPVIMLTARDVGEDVELALQKKADGYIAKPYDHNYLVQKVRHFLKDVPR